MINIETSIVVNQSTEKVFAFMSVHDNALQWQSGLLEARVTSEITGVGKTWTDVVQFLGRRIELPFELTEYELNQKIGFKSISGPMPVEGSYTFEPVADATKVTFTLAGEPGGFFRLAEPIVARTTRRQWETNLANLKDLLESQG
jgi:uncharacterized membrane protein